MFPDMISRNCRPISQLFQFLSVFGIDRFTVLEIDNGVIRAKVGWPSDGSTHYNSEEDVQEVSWSVDDDPNLDDALYLLQELSMAGQVDNDKITATEAEIDGLASRLNIPRNSLEKLLSIKVHMVDNGRKTDFFFVHL